MSDEPLYCVHCGMEIGCGCECGASIEDETPPREYRYCDVCGVIPAPGKECSFYQRGGNKSGCSA